MEKRLRELEVGFASQTAEIDTMLANILARLSRIEAGIVGLIGMALVSCLSAIWYLLVHNIHVTIVSNAVG